MTCHVLVNPVLTGLTGNIDTVLRSSDETIGRRRLATAVPLAVYRAPALPRLAADTAFTRSRHPP